MKIYYTPAKLNLFLDILSKREDGYHEILSLMVKVSLFDILQMDKNRSGGIYLYVEGDAPLGEDNICYKAAKLVMERFGIQEGLEIRLKKIIPKESGLGGASSNAAYVIRGMNEIFKLNLEESQLMEIGSQVGSDVPFFLSDAVWAVVSGKGDEVRKVSSNFRFYALLVVPDFGISTREAYSQWRPSLTAPRYWDKIKSCKGEEIDLNFLRKYRYNVFEEIVRDEGISLIKSLLEERGAEVTGMSGTGSCVFGLYSSRKEAMHGAEEIRSLGYKAYVVEPVKEGGACVGDHRGQGLP